MYGETDGHSIWPFGVAVDKHDTVYVTDEWTNTVSVLTTGKWTVRSPRLGADAA